MRSLDKKTELLRAIAHPVRIKILEELNGQVRCVSNLEEFLKISQPNVSQHLTVLRKEGVLDFYVEGRRKCYFLMDPMVADILKILKRNYKEKLPTPSCSLVTGREELTGKRRRVQKATPR